MKETRLRLRDYRGLGNVRVMPSRPDAIEDETHSYCGYTTGGMVQVMIQVVLRSLCVGWIGVAWITKDAGLVGVSGSDLVSLLV